MWHLIWAGGSLWDGGSPGCCEQVHSEHGVAVLIVTGGHAAEMPEGIPKNAEFSQLLVYLGISERSEFGWCFGALPSTDDSLIFFPSSCNRDAESFSNGIFLSLGFSTCWNKCVFPGKVAFHPSLSAKPLFLISLGVFLPQSHSFHSLSIEFSLSPRLISGDPPGSVLAFRTMFLSWMLCSLDALTRHWWFPPLLLILE